MAPRGSTRFDDLDTENMGGGGGERTISRMGSMSPSSPKASVGVVSLQLQQFLDEWHYRIVHTSLGKTWTRKEAILGFIELMAINGLPCTEEDRWWAVKRATEEQLVQWLAENMPVEMRENFEMLTKQLQLVIQLVTRVRKGIEASNHEDVQQVIEESDTSGVGQAVLKQAVIHAGHEVHNLLQCQETWVVNTEARIDRLLKAAEMAEHCNQQLLAVEAQLENYGVSSKKKGKEALMGLASQNEKTLKSSAFAGWLGLTIRARADRALRDQYEKRIAAAEDELFRLKEARFANIRGAIVRKGAEESGGILNFLFKTWLEELHAAKREGGTKRELAEMEAKLKASKEGQAEATKKMLARMLANKEGTLLEMCFQTWHKCLEDLRKDKEFEAQVAASEAQLKAFLDKKKEQAKQVLDRISGGTNTGLMANFFKEWYTYTVDRKKADEMEAQMGAGEGRFKALQGRHLNNARGVQNRVNEQINANLMLRVFMAWFLETKVNHAEQYYTNKLEGKRRQLNSVQTLFRGFAKQLDEGLGNVEGDSSGRTRPTRRSSAGLGGERPERPSERHGERPSDPYRPVKDPYKALPPAAMPKSGTDEFDMMDANRDGVVTRTEYEQHKAKKAQAGSSSLPALT